MDSIFFEKQEGQLCAQHCLNNLLQDPIFTAVDLANFAQQLDEEEKATMAEGGLTNPDFIRFMQQPSSNMDDSGYFSVQVIAKALSVWNLELESLTSPQMKSALDDPTSQRAFICHHESHWLTVRKLGYQWFNLDSLLKRPELISDTYLSLFLHQLQMEGYAIFVVIGILPECEANQVLSLVRAEPPLPRAGHSSSKRPSCPWKESGETLHVNPGKRHCEDISRGIKRSFNPLHSPEKRDGGKEEQDLQMAMAMSVSLQQSQEQFEIDQQLQLHSTKVEDPVSDELGGSDYEEEEEEVALTAAIYASLEDEQRGKESANEDTNTQTKDANVLTIEERVRERKEGDIVREEGSEGGTTETEQGGIEPSDIESSSLPLSQEELRMKRLQHLKQ